LPKSRAKEIIVPFTPTTWSTPRDGTRGYIAIEGEPEPMLLPAVHRTEHQPDCNCGPCRKIARVLFESSGAETPAPSPASAPCVDQACAPCDGGGIMAGFAFNFLKPYYANSTASLQTTSIGLPTPVVTATEFDWNYELAPTIWLGWTAGDGVGFRTQYFTFDHGAPERLARLNTQQAPTTSILPPGSLLSLPEANFSSPGIFLAAGFGLDQVRFSSGLDIHSLDVEATWARQWGRFSMLVTGGGRYLHLDQDYSAALINRVPDVAGLELQLLQFRNRFDGGGPTVSWFGRYQLGNSGFAFVGSVRGALLVGATRQDQDFFRQIVDPGVAVGGSQIVHPISSSGSDTVLPVAEFMLGAEYGLELDGIRPFARAAVVNHTYFDAGGPAQRDGNLSLFGAQFALGVNY
jgi:hypothetical protein